MVQILILESKVEKGKYFKNKYFILSKIISFLISIIFIIFILYFIYIKLFSSRLEISINRKLSENNNYDPNYDTYTENDNSYYYKEKDNNDYFFLITLFFFCSYVNELVFLLYIFILIKCGGKDKYYEEDF